MARRVTGVGLKTAGLRPSPGVPGWPAPVAEPSAGGAGERGAGCGALGQGCIMGRLQWWSVSLSVRPQRHYGPGAAIVYCPLRRGPALVGQRVFVLPPSPARLRQNQPIGSAQYSLGGTRRFRVTGVEMWNGELWTEGERDHFPSGPRRQQADIITPPQHGAGHMNKTLSAPQMVKTQCTWDECGGRRLPFLSPFCSLPVW